MRYLLTGGGSGGHIYPLLSFAKVIAHHDPTAEFLFVGKKGKMEEQIVPQADLDFVTVSTTGTKGLLTLQNIKAAFMISVGLIQARSIIKKFNPDVCIGAGGYVSVPIMMQANKMNKKFVTAVLETDQFMGRANLQLARKSDLIFSGMFDLSAKYFPENKNYFQVGHPRSEELYQEYHQEIKNHMQDTTVKTITFIGGSLGAETINQQAILLAQKQQDLPANKQVKILLVTGKRYYEQYADYMKQYPCLEVVGFVDNIAAIYLKTDLLVCRAGAGLLAEAATFGLPTIIIPSPNVAFNHQHYNATYFVQKNAAVMYEETDIIEDNFVDALLALTKNTQQLQSYKEAIHQLADVDSVSQMYQHIKAVWEEKNHD